MKKQNRYIRPLYLWTVMIVLFLIVPLGGCGNSQKYNPLDGVSTTEVTDDTGRIVEVPETITRIATSGSTAQMILMTLAPDMLVGLTSSPTEDQMAYFPEDMWYLPTFGQFYGGKANLNMEALIEAQPQVVIDLGDRHASARSDMNGITKQTGIPAVFYEATLDTMPNAYRQLGELLGREEEAEKLAEYVENTVQYAEEALAVLS